MNDTNDLRPETVRCRELLNVVIEILDIRVLLDSLFFFYSISVKSVVLSQTAMALNRIKQNKSSWEATVACPGGPHVVIRTLLSASYSTLLIPIGIILGGLVLFGEPFWLG